MGAINDRKFVKCNIRTDKDGGQYREKTWAKVYMFEGEYALRESLLYAKSQSQREWRSDVTVWPHPLCVVVADECVRTRSCHPASVIKVSQPGYATLQERILHCIGITEPSEQVEMSFEIERYWT